MTIDPQLSALREGDDAALGALFERYADRIYRLAVGLLHEPAEAEDVVQESFVKALTNLDRFEGRSGIGTWLYRVAYNAAMDRLRRRGREPATESGDMPSPHSMVDWSSTPEALLLDNEARAALDAATDTLSASLRAVFILRDVEGLSTSEAAEALGISESAAKVRLHRARLQLRERLSEYFSERLTEGEPR
ncbi:MAG: sigma-70 family RNA polymerase sigma factor [Gemmatimonadota bacterium]|jgi:RNA polymerase sigma-70 factor (ECF subfamily)